jgi:hypothetical protein
MNNRDLIPMEEQMALNLCVLRFHANNNLNACDGCKSDIIYLIDKQQEDRKLLDYLDKTIQYASSVDNYGDEQLDYCYWEIRGQCHDIRTAIKDDMEYQKQKLQLPPTDDDLPF